MIEFHRHASYNWKTGLLGFAALGLIVLQAIERGINDLFTLDHLAIGALALGLILAKDADRTGLY